MENIVQGQWFGTSGADLGSPIDQSLRFRESQRLERTPSSAGNRKTWTLSLWTKIGSIGVDDPRTFFLAYNSIENRTGLFFETRTAYNGILNVAAYSQTSSTLDGNYMPSAVLRDHSAWYHLVFVCDTTDATAADRFKIYINGVHQSDLTTNTQFGLNDDTWVNSTNAHHIGYFPTTQFYDGYIAEMYLLDGTAVGDTNGVIDEFGRYNENGVWVPQNYTGSGYGTNGFHLTFDSSQTNGIGHDSSGNGNDFTATGFDTAAISSSNFDNDIDYEDTPTNNHPTLNPLTKSDTGSLTAGTPVWSAGNLEFRAHNTDDTGTQRARSTMATMGVTSGKWYFECTRPHITPGATPNNSWVMGWATSAPPHTSPSAGSGFTDIENYALFDGFNGHTKANGATIQSPQSTPTEATDQILAYAFDFDSTSNNVKLYHNNTLINTMSFDIGDSVMLPMAWSGYGSRYALNYGQRPFVYTPPTDHVGLESNLLPEPTIKNGKEHFDVVTYTGNATARSITGLQFQPDFVWIKAISGSASSHALYDSVRGATIGLFSNRTDAEETDANNLTSFDADGFSLGTGNTSVAVNASAIVYVAWCWKAGGTAVSNTDGTITSSVSANTDAGFSIVRWTGNATQNATVGHGLTKAPEMIFIKNLDDSQDWTTYTTVADGSLDYASLNGNAAWGNTSGQNSPTTSVFSLWEDNGSNGSGDDTIAYCWHSVENYCKIGSYEANGSTDGPFVYLGFTPSLLIIRNRDGSGGWGLYDSARFPNNPNNGLLYANSNNIESAFVNRPVDFLSNGFKIRDSNSNLNSSGTYVYMAWAEHPFGGENVPPATAR